MHVNGVDSTLMTDGRKEGGWMMLQCNCQKIMDIHYWILVNMDEKFLVYIDFFKSNFKFKILN